MLGFASSLSGDILFKLFPFESDTRVELKIFWFLFALCFQRKNSKERLLTFFLSDE